MDTMHRTATVTVRTERPGDARRITEINDAAFGGPVEGRIVEDLRGTDRWIDGGSLVAETPGGDVVGHVLLSIGELETAEGSRRALWVLGPVSVTPELQGQGVGAALMRAAIQVARDHHQPVICLLGHATYYPRFGFEPGRAIGLLPPKPWRDENWLALRLPGWTPVLRGIVHFPPEFPED